MPKDALTTLEKHLLHSKKKVKIMEMIMMYVHIVQPPTQPMQIEQMKI